MTAEEYFNKIISIPIDQSELYEKINWLKLKIGKYPESIDQMKKMIDIGCGVGVFLYWFENLISGWMKYGVEPTSEFSKIASKKTDAKIFNSEFQPGIVDFKFDLICFVQVIEHIHNPVHFMKSLKNELSPNGFLFLETPSDKNIKYLDPSNDVFMSPHLFLLNEVTMDILVTKTNLKIVDYERVKNYRGVLMERTLLTVN
jgi:2-polyprenyl-3-methyl-5-hydroxy-6-metoxy-1,4-benzoquinol methylase